MNQSNQKLWRFPDMDADVTRPTNCIASSLTVIEKPTCADDWDDEDAEDDHFDW